MHVLTTFMSALPPSIATMPKHLALQESQPIYPVSHLQKRRHVDQQDAHPYATFAIQNPITVPEILILIGGYLDSRTATFCLRVCKAWYALMLPRVWFEVSLTKRAPTDGPLLHDVQKNSLLIRKLGLIVPKSSSDFLDGQQLHFRNLRELKLYPMSRNSLTNVDDEPLVTFIKAHRATLEKVDCFHDTSNVLLDALEECSRLRQLTVRLRNQTLYNQEQWKSRFDKLWSRPVVLTLEGIGPPQTIYETFADLKKLDRMLVLVGSTDIQHLDLIHVCQHAMLLEHLVLIVKSPRLKSLKWTVRGLDNMALLALICQSHQFGQQLDSLFLTHADFKNRDFQVVLQSLPLLTRLRVPYSSFNMVSWKVLQVGTPRYLSTLKELDLSLCRQVTGAIVHEVLCSVATLEVFLADYITDGDIDNPRPWTCVGLQHLTLAFVLVSENLRLRVFERLSTLTKLSTLKLDMFSVIYHCVHGQISILSAVATQQCLQFMLSTGMGKLINLKLLRVLRGPFCRKTTWTMTEARWVMKHWPNLEVVEGIGMNANAAQFLEEKIRIFLF